MTSTGFATNNKPQRRKKRTKVDFVKPLCAPLLPLQYGFISRTVFHAQSHPPQQRG